MSELRISLLHLALKPGELASNYAIVERGIRAAAATRGDWIVTPELCISGYQFVEVIGTDWISEQPDEWTMRVCGLARSLRRSICFAHADRSGPDKIYNAVFLIDADGEIVGHHRKINTHAESWASPGDLMQPASCHGIKVGVLICANAYTAAIAQTLRSKGAQLLVSSAAWAPGLNGPEGEWEDRTVETRLPLIVCNRTGTEGTLTFNSAAKVSSKVGRVMPVKAGNANPRSAASPINLTSLTKSPLASGSLDPRPTTIIAVRSRFAGWLSHSRSIAASTIAG